MASQVEQGFVPGSGPAETTAASDGYPTNEAQNGRNQTIWETAAMAPLKLKGTLDQSSSFDLRAPNSDELLRDLAITVSQHGVVFFRVQDGLDDNLQKTLAHRLGELSGKPIDTKLHIHSVPHSSYEGGAKDPEITIINSRESKTLYKGSTLDPSVKKQSHKDGWHSDITYEPVPSDYAVLRLTELPGTGGELDTLWASGYELFDRISRPYQIFLEGLTATHAQPSFNEVANNSDLKLYTAPRGSPYNVGKVLQTVHPIIRTNPVTGWKSVFAIGRHVQEVNDLAPLESTALLEWFVRLIVENHDLQVRHRWQNPNDVAIWDNRSVYHTPTPGYEGLGDRTGLRATSLGGKPYLDPNGKSRREALEAELGDGLGVGNET